MEAYLAETFSKLAVEKHFKPERPIDLTNFELVKILGQGRYGKVALMYDRATNLNFAVKICSLENNPQYPTQYWDLKVEAEILKKLAGSTFFCQMYFTCTTEQNAWFCLQFYPGSLDDLIKMYSRGNTKLSFPIAQSLLAEIVIALRKLQKKCIIHRDLKPDNILIDEEGHVVLADFGLSKILDKSKPLGHQACREFFEKGTPFTAPETLDPSRTHSYPSDLYSFGVTIGRLCAEENLDETWTSDNKKDVQDLQNLLTKTNPNERPTAKYVSKHNFFSRINWQDVEGKKLDMKKCQPFEVLIQKPDKSNNSTMLDTLRKPQERQSRCLEKFSTYEGYRKLIG